MRMLMSLQIFKGFMRCLESDRARFDVCNGWFSPQLEMSLLNNGYKKYNQHDPKLQKVESFNCEQLRSAISKIACNTDTEKRNRREALNSYSYILWKRRLCISTFKTNFISCHVNLAGKTCIAVQWIFGGDGQCTPYIHTTLCSWRRRGS